jgi:hypothetical protein
MRGNYTICLDGEPVCGGVNITPDELWALFWKSDAIRRRFIRA